MAKPVQLSVPFDFAPKRRSRKLRDINSQTRGQRLIYIAGISSLWVCVLVWRLYSLQIAGFEQWSQSALKQHLDEVQLASERGQILDRNGKLLAVSVPSGSVYFRPKQVKDKQKTAELVSKIIDIPSVQLTKLLQEPKPFVWVKRQIPRMQAKQVDQLNLPGVGYFLESKRTYPNNEAASTLIGRVGIDGQGLSGLEMVYNDILHSEELTTRVGRDALGKQIQLPDEETDFSLPRGSALQLTLDAGLQAIVDEELERGRVGANAKAAFAAMIDSNTGEILALSQAPGINLNRDKVPSKDLRNPLIEAVFEPGSIMKPIVTAGAIDAGVVSPSQLVDCESGHFKVGRYTVNDVHPVSVVSVRDVVVRSSNIGMTKIGFMLGEDRLHGILEKFGFGQASGLKLPGESAGILRDASGWAKIDLATHSYGQGVSVTPLQVVRAVAAIANGGKLPKLKIVSDDQNFEQKRILGERAAASVKEMMYAVVEDQHGTGHLAAVPGVRIGGKTGTAQKPIIGGRGYRSGAYIASFVGFADASAIGIPDNLTLVVSIDEPSGKSIYGGVLAAPVFSKIMHRALHLLRTRRELGTTPSRMPEGLRPVVFYQ